MITGEDLLPFPGKRMVWAHGRGSLGFFSQPIGRVGSGCSGGYECELGGLRRSGTRLVDRPVVTDGCTAKPADGAGVKTATGKPIVADRKRA